jgi:hypothetical protein
MYIVEADRVIAMRHEMRRFVSDTNKKTFIARIFC